MFEIDQIYEDKFVKFEVTLLVELTPKKEVNIEPFDFRVVFGDPNLIGALGVWDSLFSSFPVAYTQFINAHPDHDFELTNPLVVRIGGHFELNRYRAVFEMYLEEETGINDDVTDDDKAVILRIFYEFDENIRTKNGLRKTPLEVKQKLYDEHFEVDKFPYMIADNVPHWEDRPKDPTIELIDITDEMKAERKTLRAMKKRLFRPTEQDRQIAIAHAQQLLMLYEERYPTIDFSQPYFEGTEALEVLKDNRAR